MPQQLRLAYVNLKIVSASTKRSSEKFDHASLTSLPSLARKAMELQRKRPAAAAVIEELIDDALSHIA